ncbi:hypothetical protein LTR56_014687 [Elasticomyces elasticus]|nr:hypothetical protein LTR56_014687 [Elasticomyces elasticus]KAK3636806.1 hypothetical protein LTR22_018559 [Elasticomyces elasticus]KAK4912510.1 hypothetical protein LTR49_019054 [Elasticomyces elasticus]
MLSSLKSAGPDEELNGMRCSSASARSLRTALTQRSAICAEAILDSPYRPPKSSIAYKSLSGLLSYATEHSKVYAGDESIRRVRLVAAIVATWGLAVVEHYQWHEQPSRKLLGELKTVSKLCPEWSIAARRLNAVMLCRHDIHLTGAESRQWVMPVGTQPPQVKRTLPHSPVTNSDLKFVIEWVQSSRVVIGLHLLSGFGRETDAQVDRWTDPDYGNVMLSSGFSLASLCSRLKADILLGMDQHGLLVPAACATRKRKTLESLWSGSKRMHSEPADAPDTPQLATQAVCCTTPRRNLAIFTPATSSHGSEPSPQGTQCSAQVTAQVSGTETARVGLVLEGTVRPGIYEGVGRYPTPSLPFSIANGELAHDVCGVQAELSVPDSQSSEGDEVSELDFDEFIAAPTPVSNALPAGSVSGNEHFDNGDDDHNDDDDNGDDPSGDSIRQREGSCGGNDDGSIRANIDPSLPEAPDQAGTCGIEEDASADGPRTVVTDCHTDGNSIPAGDRSLKSGEGSDDVSSEQDLLSLFSGLTSPPDILTSGAGVEQGHSYVRPRSRDCPLCENQCCAAFVPEGFCGAVREPLFQRLHSIYDLILCQQDSHVSSVAQKSWALPLHLARVYYEPAALGASSCGKDEAEVWCFDAESLRRYAESEEILDRPLIIKESFRDSFDITRCKRIIQDRLTRKLEVYDPCTGEIVAKESGDILAQLNNPTQAYNTLKIKPWANADKPLLTMLPRYSLLDVLHDRLRSPSIGASSMPLDAAGHVSFDLLDFTGAFSGAHVGSLVGTWVRTLFGSRVWMFVPPLHMSDQDWEELARQGGTWDPTGKARAVLLEKDDVFFMPPGLLFPHAVFTAETSMMEGGMVWDEQNVLAILSGLHWIAEHQVFTDEPIANHLHLIVRHAWT